MEISEDTKNVVNTLEQFADKTLRKKNDVNVIVELAVSFGEAELFNKTLFNGKAFWNLSKTLRKIDQIEEEEAAKNFKAEFERFLEIFKENIADIISNAEDKEVKKRFDATYFQITRGCVLNLIDLAHDIGKFKDMQAYHKRQRKNSEN